MRGCVVQRSRFRPAFHDRPSGSARVASCALERLVLPIRKRIELRPEAGDFVITFDGGALGNPGKGYGSYHIAGPDGFEARERLDYGDRVTNNQAEYRTLIAALTRILDDFPGLRRTGRVTVRGDSQLVI